MLSGHREMLPRPVERQKRSVARRCPQSEEVEFPEPRFYSFSWKLLDKHECVFPGRLRSNRIHIPYTIGAISEVAS